MASRQALDPRLSKVIDLWRGSAHEGERHAASRRGAALAASLGMTFQEAVAAADAFERRAAVLALYGSERAALAPCWREAKLRHAVGRWAVPQDARWTRSVDGCESADDLVSARVLDALANAYPLPETVEQAAEEHRHWTRRAEEIDALLGDGAGLDVIAGLRAAMIRDNLMRKLNMQAIGRLNRRFDRQQALDCVQGSLRDLRAADPSIGDWQRTHIGIAIGHILLHRYDLVEAEVRLALGGPRPDADFEMPDGFDSFDLASFERVVSELLTPDAGSSRSTTVTMNEVAPPHSSRHDRRSAA